MGGVKSKNQIKTRLIRNSKPDQLDWFGFYLVWV